MPRRDQAMIDRMRAQRRAFRAMNPDVLEVDRHGSPLVIDAAGDEIAPSQAPVGKRTYAPVVVHRSASDQTAIRDAQRILDSCGGDKIASAFHAITEVVGMLDGVLDRVEALEKGNAQQRGLAFKGEHQVALDYSANDVVTRNGRVYVATRAVAAGDQLRDGSPGWALMFKGLRDD